MAERCVGGCGGVKRCGGGCGGVERCGGEVWWSHARV